MGVCLGYLADMDMPGLDGHPTSPGCCWVSTLRQLNEPLQGQVWAEEENQDIFYITKSRKRHQIYKKPFKFEGNATGGKMSDEKCG